jgi:hypothetical protein
MAFSNYSGYKDAMNVPSHAIRKRMSIFDSRNQRNKIKI